MKKIRSCRKNSNGQAFTSLQNKTDNQLHVKKATMVISYA